MKTCIKCLACKPVTDFPAARDRKDGRKNTCSACNRAIVAAWQKDNPERAKARQKAWNSANRERANANARARREVQEIADKRDARNKAYYEANKEKVLQTAKAWKDRNPDAVKASGHRRRARKANASGSYSAKDVQSLMTTQRCRCVVCGKDIKDGYHVDHVMPLALGGSNDRSNIQLLCAFCNFSKGAKHPVDFMQRNGFLL